MQIFTIFMLVSVVLVDFLQRVHVLPGFAGYTPELLGACALVCVVTLGVRARFRLISPLYLLIFSGILFVMFCGVIINAVESGPLFTGIRNYMRAMPFFLLPAVFAFSERQVSQQLRVLMGLCLLQLPLALYQKMQPNVTGDSIYGTLMVSSILSMFLICSTCVLIGFYLRGYLRLPMLILLGALFLLPATINETKGTLVLFPLAAAATFILGAKRGMRFKNVVIASGIVVAFISGFAAVYDYTQRDRLHRQSIIEFFSGDQVDTYLESGRGFTSDRKEIKRIDTIKVTYGYLAQDPIHLIFGLGIGNASRSALGTTFEGQYTRLFSGYLFLTGVRIFVETGFLGLALVMALMLLIFRDAYIVSRDDSGKMGAISAGWLGVVVVIIPGMFYKDIMATNAISFLFWYFCGLVAARSMAIAHERAASRYSAGTAAMAARLSGRPRNSRSAT